MNNFIEKQDFTGERFIPEYANPESDIYNFHMERYKLATLFVKDKIVLDCSCGDGYGSFMLSKLAKTVYGLDKSEETIKLAQIKYKSDNINFLIGQAENLSFQENLFDIIVSFETIEHLNKMEQLSFINGVKKSLKSGGLFIISTPDKDIYGSDHNEFHLAELSKVEFINLLSKYFIVDKLYGQNIRRVKSFWAVFLRILADKFRAIWFWKKIKHLVPQSTKLSINNLTEKYVKGNSSSLYVPQELVAGFSGEYIIALCKK
jgi:2-polyprenyl-3-methyl-5-hydroxy-6-metoxy-1,4-benzoquinol methylase